MLGTEKIKGECILAPLLGAPAQQSATSCVINVIYERYLL